MNQAKIFIVGLPRTGTTSLCAYLLNLGYKVAHTAYTFAAFDKAEVIADTPVFCDYAQLHEMYPGSKYIYLDRGMQAWLPSIKALLAKLCVHLSEETRRENLIIKNCFERTFGEIGCWPNLNSEQLARAYLKHRRDLFEFLDSTESDYVALEIGEANACLKLNRFLQIRHSLENSMPRMNTDGRVFEWGNIKHPLKISPHERLDGKRIYIGIDDNRH